MVQQSKQAIGKLGLEELDFNSLVRNLSIAQQQMVEIGKALFNNANILVMDEPTSVLSQKETDALFQLIKGLRQEGISIIYISHRLEELMQIGDYITVLRDGNLRDEKPMDAIDVPWIINQMVGEASVTSVKTKAHTAGDEVLRVESVSLPRQVCMFLARKLTPHSLEEIGGYFGGRDHTTVMYADERVAGLSSEDAEFRRNLETFERELTRG